MTTDRHTPDLADVDCGLLRDHRQPELAGTDTTAMRPGERLADAWHPLVRETAARLGEGCGSPREQLERFVVFVRDEILFGFPPESDLTAASVTLRLGIGQCNTKGTLLLAVCEAAGIPARLHFAPIRKSIQRGLYTGVWYLLLPRHVSHSWLEAQIDGRWRRIDAYINDGAFCRAAALELERRGWREGFSLAGACAQAGEGFDLDAARFVQMDAVEGDHGVWTEPADYYRSRAYLNRTGPIKTRIYQSIAPGINDTIQTLRASVLTSGPHSTTSTQPVRTRI